MLSQNRLLTLQRERERESTYEWRECLSRSGRSQRASANINRWCTAGSSALTRIIAMQVLLANFCLLILGSGYRNYKYAMTRGWSPFLRSYGIVILLDHSLIASPIWLNVTDRVPPTIIFDQLMQLPFWRQPSVVDLINHHWWWNMFSHQFQPNLIGPSHLSDNSFSRAFRPNKRLTYKRSIFYQNRFLKLKSMSSSSSLLSLYRLA